LHINGIITEMTSWYIKEWSWPNVWAVCSARWWYSL